MNPIARNPEEKEKDPIPIYFEMNNCSLTCPKLTDLMVAQVSCDWPTPGHVTLCSPLIAQAYLGFAVTYEDILCGQIGLKHCKVWPGQKKVELLRVNTNVTGNQR